MIIRRYFEDGDRAGRVMEVSSIDNLEVAAGKVKIVPEGIGCSVDSTVFGNEEKTDSRLIRSSIGGIRLPFFEQRLNFAIEAAVIQVEVGAEIASSFKNN